MATRRSRIVIKPNIRPAAKASTAASKTKTALQNTPSDLSTQSSKSQSSLPSSDDVSQLSARHDDGKEKKDLHGSSLDRDLQLSKSSSVKEDASNLAVDSNQNTPSEVKEISTKSCHIEPESKGKTTESEEVNVPVKNAEITGPNIVNPVATENPPTESGKTSNAFISPEPSEPRDVTDSATVHLQGSKSNSKQDEGGEKVELTPSEVDGSCMSEAMSLELEEERRGEVDDEVQKKPRRRRTKKLRNEPLPSREKSPDRQKMKMSDLLSWNPQQNFLQTKTKKKTVSVSKDESAPVSPSSNTIGDDDKESSNQSASLPAPQVMIGPDGNIVINTESLLIHAPQDDSKPKEIIEEDDDNRYLNTNSYRKYKKTKLWTERETEKFFLGLSMCGTDFSLLTNLLPSRSRRELKNKFRREERRNRHLIDKALTNQQHYDPSPFKKMDIEDDIKAKKEIQLKNQKKLKKESAPAKKAEKIPKQKRGRKRKHSVSEEEEDDWGPEYDVEDEENVDEQNEEAKKISGVRRKKAASGATPNIATNGPNNTHTLSSGSNQISDPNDSLLYSQDESQQLPQYSENDLDSPRIRAKPKRNYSRFGSENMTNQGQAKTAGVSNGNDGSANSSNNYSIQTIPGSSQVQIEMEGVQTPVKGVLIPSHMVPQIAPQLGIQGNSSGMQVLLVQEETDSGSLVHVYVIPEGETPKAPVGNSSSSLPSLTSPIPSPHPTTPIHNPPQYAPFPTLPSPHPTDSQQSPYPTASVQDRGLLSPTRSPFSQFSLLSPAPQQQRFQPTPPPQQSYQPTPPVQYPRQSTAIQNSQVPIQSPPPLCNSQPTGPVLNPHPRYQIGSSAQPQSLLNPPNRSHSNSTTSHSNSMSNKEGNATLLAHTELMEGSLLKARSMETSFSSNSTGSTIVHTTNSTPQQTLQFNANSCHTRKHNLLVSNVSQSTHGSHSSAAVGISSHTGGQITESSTVVSVNLQPTIGIHDKLDMIANTKSACESDVRSVIATEESVNVLTANEQLTSGLHISSSIGESSGNGEESDDCCILNADKPQSQVDVSAMSNT